MILTYVLGIVFALIYSIMDAVHDAAVIRWANDRSEKYRDMWHGWDTWIKGFVMGYIALLLFTNFYPFEGMGGWLLFGNAVRLFLFMALTRWIFFDATINVLLYGWANIFRVDKTSRIGKSFSGKFFYWWAKFIAAVFVAVTFAIF